MKFEEWKKVFTKKCDEATEAFKEVGRCLEGFDDEEVDEDEFLTFVAVKVNRINKEIQEALE